MAGMTVRDLKVLIGTVLKEVFGDPDASLELRPEFEERLRRAVADVSSEERLLSVEELSRRLGDASAVGTDVSQ